MEISRILMCRTLILWAIDHHVFPVMAPMQLRKPILPQMLLLCTNNHLWSKEISNIPYSKLTILLSLSIFDIVDLPIRNINDWGCCEAPVAKYLKLSIKISDARIAFLDLHGFLAISGPTSVRSTMATAPFRRSQTTKVYAILSTILSPTKKNNSLPIEELPVAESKFLYECVICSKLFVYGIFREPKIYAFDA